MKGNRIGEDFEKMKVRLKALMNDTLPNEAMAKAEELVQEAFDKEQYQGRQSPSKWKARKKEPDAERSDRSGILVRSGRLRASIEARRQDGNIILSAGYEVGKWNLAQIHNEGEDPQPERQFMPKPGEEMPTLDEHLNKFMDSELDKIYNGV